MKRSNQNTHISQDIRRNQQKRPAKTDGAEPGEAVYKGFRKFTAILDNFYIDILIILGITAE